MDEQSIWIQMRTHERNLLTQRLMVFLTFSTILFLGFTTLISGGSSWFCVVVALLGLASVPLAYKHFKPIADRLDRFEDEKQIPENIRPLWSKYYKEAKGRFRGRKTPKAICLFFSVLWIASLVYSIVIL